jgi:hypothetical protein
MLDKNVEVRVAVVESFSWLIQHGIAFEMCKKLAPLIHDPSSAVRQAFCDFLNHSEIFKSIVWFTKAFHNFLKHSMICQSFII